MNNRTRNYKRNHKHKRKKGRGSTKSLPIPTKLKKSSKRTTRRTKSENNKYSRIFHERYRYERYKNLPTEIKKLIGIYLQEELPKVIQILKNNKKILEKYKKLYKILGENHYLNEDELREKINEIDKQFENIDSFTEKKPTLDKFFLSSQYYKKNIKKILDDTNTYKDKLKADLEGLCDMQEKGENFLLEEDDYKEFDDVGINCE